MRIRSMSVLAAVVALQLPSAARGDPGGWETRQLEPGSTLSYSATHLGSTEPGQIIILYRRWEEYAHWVFASRYGTTSDDSPSVSELDQSGHHAGLASSFQGGAIAVWSAGDYYPEVRYSTIEPGSDEWSEPVAHPSLGLGHSFDVPRVAMAESGAAVLTYVTDAEHQQQLVGLWRPPGGDFGGPEPIGVPQPWVGYNLVLRDVDVAENGTVVAAFRYEGSNAVAIRDPVHGWGPVQVLGPGHEYQYFTPEVGIDADGNAVVAWSEPSASGRAPIKVAFARPGEPFGPGLVSGVDVTQYDRVQLDVSDAGEALVVAESKAPYDHGDLPVVEAFLGNTLTQQIGHAAVLSEPWGAQPRVGFNGRGDALVVWDECCPMTLQARRRGPFESFGSIEEVAPPMMIEESRRGRWALDAYVDEFGNGAVSWTDTEPEPHAVYVAQPHPLITEAPPPPGDIGMGLMPIVPGATPGPFEPPAEPAPGEGSPAPRLRLGLDREAGLIVLRVRSSEDARVRLRPSLRSGPRLRSIRTRLQAGQGKRVSVTTADTARRRLVRMPRGGGLLRVTGTVTGATGTSVKIDRRLSLPRR